MATRNIASKHKALLCSPTGNKGMGRQQSVNIGRTCKTRNIKTRTILTESETSLNNAGRGGIVVIVRCGHYNKSIYAVLVDIQGRKKFSGCRFAKIGIGSTFIRHMAFAETEDFLIPLQKFHIVIKERQLIINANEILRNNAGYAADFDMFKPCSGHGLYCSTINNVVLIRYPFGLFRKKKNYDIGDIGNLAKTKRVLSL